MQYRALFIGGPIDGQERVLRAAVSQIYIANPKPRSAVAAAEIVTYQRLFAFGSPQVFVYSVWDTTETLLHVWNHYTGGRYA